MTTDRKSNPRNLNPATLGTLVLDPAKPGEYLLELRGFVESRALEAIGWYLHRKGSIANLSKFLRLCAIALATLGALLPLIGGTPLVEGILGQAADNYGYGCLALSGATVLLDKLFGFSSRWMRYWTALVNCTACTDTSSSASIDRAGDDEAVPGQAGHDARGLRGGSEPLADRLVGLVPGEISTTGEHILEVVEVQEQQSASRCRSLVARTKAASRSAYSSTARATTASSAQSASGRAAAALSTSAFRAALLVKRVLWPASATTIPRYSSPKARISSYCNVP
nr:SLATT domain-containing protein [uncultured Thiodictyon sp.]